MDVIGWAARLNAIDGWNVWHSSSPNRGWYAVRAEDGTDHASALRLPGRIGPYATPQEVRTAIRSN